MRNLKIYIRNFKRQKLIYGITIGGFAISLAVLVAISSYILEEKSVDTHLPNIDRMYRIKQADQNSSIPKRIYQKILDNTPEIENLTLLRKNGTLYEYDTKKEYLSYITTDEKFLDIFSIQIIQGEREGLLQAKTDVLITEEFAKRVFGDENPIGEIIEFGNEENKRVKAIIANPLKSSSLKYDVIFNLDQKINQSYRGYNQERYYMYDAVFTLRAGANPADVEKKITDILQIYEGYEKTTLKIQPFKDVYFDTSGDNDSYSHANLGMIKLLSWIAFVILTLAVLNYINLTTAFNNERHREICIRKTSGARNITIFQQFIGESFLSFGIALILAAGLAILFSPLFNELFGRTVNISEALKTSEMLMVLILIFLFVGTISGLVPAFIVSKFNPIDLLQRKIKLRNSGIRGTYNTIQIAVSLSLIISLIVITKQIKYVKTKDVGFDKELLLEVGLQGRTNQKANSIKEELLNYPQILNVSGTHGRPFGTYASSSGSWKHDSVEYKIDGLINMNTDTSFLSTFGLKLIRGRNFRPTDKNVCIINQKTYEHLRLDE
ncbi:MAG TPA: ABC transporter permease, partial [Prolixibacteraceae bacterium]|nr:ABC transporter permease [Prolixibacteraceae bacterium]